jgi:hypothetical protein
MYSKPLAAAAAAAAAAQGRAIISHPTFQQQRTGSNTSECPSVSGRLLPRLAILSSKQQQQQQQHQPTHHPSPLQPSLGQCQNSSSNFATIPERCLQ